MLPRRLRFPTSSLEAGMNPWRLDTAPVFDAGQCRGIGSVLRQRYACTKANVQACAPGIFVLASVLLDASTGSARLCVFAGLAYLVAIDDRTDH